MVHLQQNGLQDRLSLAVPIHDFLSSWKNWSQAKHMAVSDDGEELAFIDDKELENYIGSPIYANCTKAIPTEQTYQSFMAKLLYHDDELLELQRCQLDVTELPLTEKARIITRLWKTIRWTKHSPTIRSYLLGFKTGKTTWIPITWPSEYHL